MFKALLEADLKRVRFQRLYLACVAYGLLVAAAYWCAHDSSWVKVPTIDGSATWGFLPGLAEDPTFFANGGLLADAIASASLAHTLFFPILVIVFVYQLLSPDVQDGAARLSFARGASRFTFLSARLAAASFILQGVYLVVSLGTAAVCTAIWQPDALAPVAQALAGNLFLNCLVNESFIMFCMAVFAWMPRGPIGGGIVFVATFIGLIAQMANCGVDLPVHMGYWMKASGLGAAAGASPSFVVFSLVSFALFAVAAYAGIVASAAMSKRM